MFKLWSKFWYFNKSVLFEIQNLNGVILCWFLILILCKKVILNYWFRKPKVWYNMLKIKSWQVQTCLSMVKLVWIWIVGFSNQKFSKCFQNIEKCVRILFKQVQTCLSMVKLVWIWIFGFSNQKSSKFFQNIEKWVRILFKQVQTCMTMMKFAQNS